MTDKTRFMTVTFTSGKKQRFEFTPIADDPNVLASRLEKMMASGHLMVHCEDRAHIFPLVNIESIEVSPAPGKATALMVQAVRELE